MGKGEFLFLLRGLQWTLILSAAAFICGIFAGLGVALLRTSGVRLQGAGEGVSAAAVVEAAGQVWEWIQDGKLAADIERVALRDIDDVWHRRDLHGRRLVVTDFS